MVKELLLRGKKNSKGGKLEKKGMGWRVTEGEKGEKWMRGGRGQGESEERGGGAICI